MTTIAYRDGIMAADRMTCHGSLKSGTVRKVHRVGRFVIGFSGAVADCFMFLKWFKGDRETPIDWKFFRGSEDAPDIHAIVAGPDGIEVWTEHCQPFPIGEDFWAVGSGAMAALAAMQMGADAIKAIEIASLVDVHTGGGVDWERVSADNSVVALESGKHS